MERTPENENVLKLCMTVGLECAAVWLMAFFCNVGAFTYPLLSLLQIGLVAVALVLPARGLVRYSREVAPLRSGRLTLLTLLSFVLCAVATTFVQSVYFRYFDGGFFAAQVLSVMDSPMLENMGAQPDVLTESLDMLGNPSTAPRVLLSTNLQFALLGTLPGALIAVLKNRKRK